MALTFDEACVVLDCGDWLVATLNISAHVKADSDGARDEAIRRLREMVEEMQVDA